MAYGSAAVARLPEREVMSQATYEAMAARRAVPGIEACRSQVDVDELVAWHLGGIPARAGARSAPAAPGLVRLETSRTIDSVPTSEEQRIRDANRRYLRLFKSISCAGDLHRLSRDDRGRRLFGIFVTLTYRPEVSWSGGQIAGYLQRCRVWLRRNGMQLRCVWVAEQHKSGRVHYHVIFFLPYRARLPKPDQEFADLRGRIQPAMWPWGGSEIARCRKQSVGYLVKYATKCRDVSRPWPKGCRLHGHGGLDRCQRVRRAWWVLPRYQRVLCEDWMEVRRAPGGGWFSPVTGECWPGYGFEGFYALPARDEKLPPVLKRGWWVTFKRPEGAGVQS